jgi:hypothetical protein
MDPADVDERAGDELELGDKPGLGSEPGLADEPESLEVDQPESLADDDVDTDAPVPESKVDDGLTDRDRKMLAFERQWWKHAGSKEQAIRDLFAITSTRYYQALNGLLDNPAALAYDPMLVARLRRLRATRARTRTTGRQQRPA